MPVDFRSFSLFTRLIDDDPKRAKDGTLQERILVEKLKESIRRDLVALLNTRKKFTYFPACLKELNFSSISYGIKDFSSYLIFTKERQEQFCTDLENTVLLYDNRLSDIRVTLDMPKALYQGNLLITLEATLILKKKPCPFMAQLVLNLKNSLFEIKGRPVQL
jgi:type VI secretion system protein ImpF